jgi:hypothetical protein
VKYILAFWFLAVSMAFGQRDLLGSESVDPQNLSDSDLKELKSIASFYKYEPGEVFFINTDALSDTDLVVNFKRKNGKSGNALAKGRYKIKKDEKEPSWEGIENGFVGFKLRKINGKFRGFIRIGNNNYQILGLSENRVTLVESIDKFQCGVKGK